LSSPKNRPEAKQPPGPPVESPDPPIENNKLSRRLSDKDYKVARAACRDFKGAGNPLNANKNINSAKSAGK